MRRVCRSKGIDPEELEGYAFWGFTLPQLGSPEHLAALAKFIQDNGIEVVIIDPLYLCLTARARRSTRPTSSTSGRSSRRSRRSASTPAPRRSWSTTSARTARTMYGLPTWRTWPSPASRSSPGSGS